MQPNLSSCQTGWWEYISNFNFTIQHVHDSYQMNNRTSDSTSESSDNDLLLAIESGMDGHSLQTNVERNVDLARIVRKHYHEDTVFVKVLECPTVHLCFGIQDKLIWTKNQMGRDVICIPWKAFLRGG